jgi:hypothetical protein
VLVNSGGNCSCHPAHLAAEYYHLIHSTTVFICVSQAPFPAIWLLQSMLQEKLLQITCVRYIYWMNFLLLTVACDMYYYVDFTWYISLWNSTLILLEQATFSLRYLPRNHAQPQLQPEDWIWSLYILMNAVSKLLYIFGFASLVMAGIYSLGLMFRSVQNNYFALVCAFLWRVSLFYIMYQNVRNLSSMQLHTIYEISKQ